MSTDRRQGHGARRRGGGERGERASSRDGASSREGAERASPPGRAAPQRPAPTVLREPQREALVPSDAGLAATEAPSRKPTRYLDVVAPAEDPAIDDLTEQALTDDHVLCVVAWARFREGANAFICDCGDLVVRPGDIVVISGESRSTALATVTVGSHRRMVSQRMPRLLRVAHEGDHRAESTRRSRENEAARAAARLVSELDLPAKVVRAEAATGGGRTTVFLTSEQRVDTRDLLRGLASAVPGRVEIRQIGARDAAAFIGGVGPCGLQLCCNTFLVDFAPVSIRMAKDQGLPLHPGRVNGVCGRLLCCLVYEHELYRAERKRFPKTGKMVETPDGPARVIDIDVLAGKLTVASPDGLRVVALEDVRVIAPAGPSARAEDDDERPSDVGEIEGIRESVVDEPRLRESVDEVARLRESVVDEPRPREGVDDRHLRESVGDEPREPEPG